jgi:signal peptidase
MRVAIGQPGTRGRWLELALGLQRQGWALVIGWLLLLFYVINYLLPRVPSADAQIYVLQPLLWSSLGGLAFWSWRREMRGAVFPADRWLLLVAVMVGAFQIALLVLAGVLAGFGNSPYAHHIHLMALNMWFVGTRLVGLELARWYLVVALGRRSIFLGVGVAWLLLSLIAVPAASFDQLGQAETAFRLTGRTLLPTAGENLLATYLVLVGGPLASIAYRGSLAAFEWLSPILPNLEWAGIAFLGTVAPVLGLLIVRDSIQWRAARESEDSFVLHRVVKTDRDAGEAASISRGEMPWRAVPKVKRVVEGLFSGTTWILVAVVAVSLLWFNTGLLGVRPTLVAGVSMEPTLETGDVVITRKIPTEDIKVGDIIHYRSENGSVLHRVVDIQTGTRGLVFVTRGDNNNVNDDPVLASQVEGEVVVTIPKIGWVAIGAKKLINWLM